MPNDISRADTNVPASDDAVIKIGAVVATKGPAARLGNSFVKAIQLAKEDLKNTTHHYELVIEEIPSPVIAQNLPLES